MDVNAIVRPIREYSALYQAGEWGGETTSVSQKRKSRQEPIASSRPERSKPEDATTRCPHLKHFGA